MKKSIYISSMLNIILLQGKTHIDFTSSSKSWLNAYIKEFITEFNQEIS